MRIQGLTTYQKFLSHLDAGQWYFQDQEQENNSFSYWPVDCLFEGVPAEAQEWHQNIIANWASPERAIICRVVPGARPRAIVHISLIEITA